MPKSPLKRPAQDGFSLIEVLIAMLILAFGVLSMGGLQVASTRSNQMAGFASTSATLAKEYTELMRSNIAISNNTSTTPGINPYLFDTSAPSSYTSVTSVVCQVSSCTSAQISTLNIADWAARVRTQLPGPGRAVVCRDPAPRNSDGTYRWDCGTNNGTEVTIKLGWVDKRDASERGTTTMTATANNPQMVIGGLSGYAE